MLNRRQRGPASESFIKNTHTITIPTGVIKQKFEQLAADSDGYMKSYYMLLVRQLEKSSVIVNPLSLFFWMFSAAEPLARESQKMIRSSLADILLRIRDSETSAVVDEAVIIAQKIGFLLDSHAMVARHTVIH